ncbi:MAG: anthranilate synthase component I family protein [Bacteroidia bacterium]|nr:anthranilate synthase component I family protein [Bacteroidia bacterium]
MDKWLKTNPDHNWLFGILSYDLKNEIEDLESRNFDSIKSSALKFFEADLVFDMIDNEIVIQYDKNGNYNSQRLKQEILGSKFEILALPYISFRSPNNKSGYLKDVNALKDHIFRGDIYEINYCREFYSVDVDIDPLSLYLRLSQRSPAPFASFTKIDEHYIFCTSPERFLKRKGDQLFSQPIKGTLKRGENDKLDQLMKTQLANSEKDRSENIMIVDLVRNDLSRIALERSVTVDELCEIYSFADLHHMISTISCKIKGETSFADIINATFPMGSMTGAPKVRAMKLIEKYEHSKRGIYSGALGYIEPNNDFDLNVLIRTVVYNINTKTISMSSGGAITSESNAEMEYQESLLKLKAIFEILNGEQPKEKIEVETNS